MVSLVSIAASRAGKVSRVLRTTIDTPRSQLEGMYHAVQLRVAHAHPHGMGIPRLMMMRVIYTSCMEHKYHRRMLNMMSMGSINQ